MSMQGGPILVFNTKTQRQKDRGAAQLSNIQAAQAVAGIVRTTLGPRSMLKLLLDPMGTVVLTNDGHCILREVDVSHPAAKSMLELSRAQDEEVGDGTTSVIVLTAEVLKAAEPFLRLSSNMTSSYGGGISTTLHPVVLVSAYSRALAVALDILKAQAINVNVRQDVAMMRKLVQSTIGTKFASRWNDIMVDMALQAVLIVAQGGDEVATDNTQGNGSNDKNNTDVFAGSDVDTSPKYIGTSDSYSVERSTILPKTTSLHNKSVLSQAEVDLKRYARVEKIPGGTMEEDCIVLKGIMFQKEPVHSSMPRRIVNPRILLLDTPLEYKKGESATNMEMTKEEDWNALLKLEEEAVERQCREILIHKPDIVITEKGVSDLAQHFLAKAGVTAFRRLRKTDNNRIARAVHATIVSRTDEIQESDIGTACGLFEMHKIGNDWFCYLTECANPKACTIVLRGGSKDVLNEMERNLQDAMQVVRNVVYQPQLVCGGGATEMAVATGLRRYGQIAVHGIQQAPFLAVAEALEVIPRTLAQNCGVNVIRTITQLRAKHAAAYDSVRITANDAVTPIMGGSPVALLDHVANNNNSSTFPFVRCTWGIQGMTGELVDMEEYGVWEPLAVKVQTIKTAMESACMLLRIDDIISGSSKNKK